MRATILWQAQVEQRNVHWHSLLTTHQIVWMFKFWLHHFTLGNVAKNARLGETIPFTNVWVLYKMRVVFDFRKRAAYGFGLRSLCVFVACGRSSLWGVNVLKLNFTFWKLQNINIKFHVILVLKASGEGVRMPLPPANFFALSFLIDSIRSTHWATLKMSAKRM